MARWFNITNIIPHSPDDGSFDRNAIVSTLLLNKSLLLGLPYQFFFIYTCVRRTWYFWIPCPNDEHTYTQICSNTHLHSHNICIWHTYTHKYVTNIFTHLLLLINFSELIYFYKIHVLHYRCRELFALFLFFVFLIVERHWNFCF